jgi:serine/threonine-protein kinase
MRPQGPSDPTFLERFRAEARSSASLHHPNIATVFDYGEEEGTAYLVMELVPGRTLSEVIHDHDGGMPAEEVRSVLGQAALALSAAHEAGVVHRDVKPANIIVTPEGRVKLTDFGIARVGDGAGHTLTGEVLGTPDYISPEQALGDPATASSDLYSLGIVAHEMVTGRKPFDMGSPVATAIAQVTDPPPELPATVPLDLREVIGACLAKSATDRPAHALAVAEATGVSVASLPGATPLPSVTVDGTRVIPTSAVSASATRALPRTADRPASRVRGRRLGWLAVPAVALVALVAWGAVALAGVMQSPVAGPAARPASTPAATATPSGTPSSSPSPTPSAATPSAPPSPTPTTSNKAAPVSTTSKPQPAHHVKGKGKGKGK